MPKIIDLTGTTHGRLTVLHQDLEKPTGRGTWWVCQCSCGNTTITKSNSLIQGLTTSCGCFRREKSKIQSTTHGESHLRIHNIWAGMLQRCKPTGEYGKRGITVCSAWEDYFIFKEWATTTGYTDSLTIDRINTKLGYFPENCRWTNTLIQARNRSKLKTATSEYYGVHKTNSGTYQALVQVGRKKIFCKTFKTEIAAAVARDAFILTHQLSGYSLNFT